MNNEAAEKLLFWMVFVLPTLMVLTAIPMILEIVPPNGAIGVRTAVSLSSEEAWYAINFRAGVAIAISSVLSIMLSLGLMKYLNKTKIQKSLYALVSFGILFMISLSIADQAY